MEPVQKSTKLDNVLYDIRGAALVQAMKMESEGYRILKLNTGNPAPFGFNAPEEVVRDMITNLNNAQGYSDSKGIFAARKAIMQYSQEKGVKGVDIGDIWVGNGVSELITIALQALLNNGDELLIPAPDYPLWTAATNLAGGKAVHYLCDEASDWAPDLADIDRNAIHGRCGRNAAQAYGAEPIRQICTSIDRIVFSFNTRPTNHERFPRRIDTHI